MKEKWLCISERESDRLSLAKFTVWKMCRRPFAWISFTVSSLRYQHKKNKIESESLSDSNWCENWFLLKEKWPTDRTSRYRWYYAIAERVFIVSGRFTESMSTVIIGAIEPCNQVIVIFKCSYRLCVSVYRNWIIAIRFDCRMTDECSNSFFFCFNSKTLAVLIAHTLWTSPFTIKCTNALDGNVTVRRH